MTGTFHPRDLDTGSAPRILLLALLPIGDSLFTTPTIRALRSRYPTARITALARTTTESLMRRVPELDDVMVIPASTGQSHSTTLARLLRILHARRYDVAIDFTSPAYKWISLAAGIPMRTYMKFDPLWWLIPAPRDYWRHTHATEHYYRCADELELPPWSDVDHHPELRLCETDVDEADALLQRYGARQGRDLLIAMHLGAAGLHGLKCWPAERFATLAAHLSERRGARIVFIGGARERAVAERLADGLPGHPIVAAGRLSLPASIALTTACDLFIGNDSGPLHAAAALGTPYVGIFGPTAPESFAPLARYPLQGTLVCPVSPCRSPQYFVGGDVIWRRPCCQGICQALATVTVDEVLGAAENLLTPHTTARQMPE